MIQLLIWWKKRRRSGLKQGAQNPEEAEWYTEKINNVFDHLSELIHQDTKTALGQTIQNFKKVVVRQ